MQAHGASLFRLLGDEDRLRLLALCSEEELTVSELATLLAESQPQVTKKTQPLREAGLLAARRDGAKTLLRTQPAASEDTIIAAALSEGRTLCLRDGSIGKISAIVAQREDASRQFFASQPADAQPVIVTNGYSYLAMFAPLLAACTGNSLAVDLGTGDGLLLPMLSPLFQRVIGVDRSASRLAHAGARVRSLALPNIRLREGDSDDATLAEEVWSRGGADVVVMMRVLHHVARPDEALISAAKLVRRSGHLIIVDYLPHDNEAMRSQGDVWLGFEPNLLTQWLSRAGLGTIVATPLSASFSADSTESEDHLPLHQLVIGRREQLLHSERLHHAAPS